MRAVDIIIKKRDHVELSREEINFFVQGFTQGRDSRLPGISLGHGRASKWHDGS